METVEKGKSLSYSFFVPSWDAVHKLFTNTILLYFCLLEDEYSLSAVEECGHRKASAGGCDRTAKLIY